MPPAVTKAATATGSTTTTTTATNKGGALLDARLAVETHAPPTPQPTHHLPPQVPHTCHPFSVADVQQKLGADALTRYTYAEVDSDSKVYPLLMACIAKQDGPNSLSLQVQSKSDDICTRQDLIDSLRETSSATAALSLGLGFFPFQYVPTPPQTNAAPANDASDASTPAPNTTATGTGTGAVTVWCLHQRIGAPVGTNCGAQQINSAVLFVESGATGGGGRTCVDAKQVLVGLAEQLLGSEVNKKEGAFTVFRWHVKYGYWKKDARCLSRPLDSVILSNEVKRRIVEDVEDFLGEDTLEFYINHGIPYSESQIMRTLTSPP